MTEKNLIVIRVVVAKDLWQEVVALPARLMGEAELTLNRSATKAATLAAYITGCHTRRSAVLISKKQSHPTRRPDHFGLSPTL